MSTRIECGIECDIEFNKKWVHVDCDIEFNKCMSTLKVWYKI